MTEDVLIAVVTHNGAQTIGELLDSLPRAAGAVSCDLMVLDNNSSDDTLEKLRIRQDFSLSICAFGNNLGVGRAYNFALKEAAKKKIKWLFLLDQDSVCTEKCLEILVQNGNALLDKSFPVGAVFSTPKSLFYPRIIHYPYRLKNWSLVPATSPEADLSPVESGISSGTLYRVQALESSGGFRESYFIDFVDHECHLRMAQHGWEMRWSHQAVIFHRLGSKQTMYPDGLWIEHEPFRYYYMARNMSHGYYRLGGLKALLSFWAQARRHMQLVLKRNSQPGKCVKYFIKGLIHAAQGKSGPLYPGN